MPGADTRGGTQVCGVRQARPGKLDAFICYIDSGSAWGGGCRLHGMSGVGDVDGQRLPGGRREGAASGGVAEGVWGPAEAQRQRVQCAGRGLAGGST